MYRKIVLLAAALLTSVLCLAGTPSRSPISPFQYGHRWYFALQGGATTLMGENADSYSANGQVWDRVGYSGQLTIGYNLSDGYEIRLSGSYNNNAGALLPYAGFYPYRFNAYHVFVDGVVNFHGLAEYNVAFSPKVYVGLGGAFTNGFKKQFEQNHPYQYTEEPNLVPGFRFGGIFEFDAPGGFGWFIDAGFEFFTDWYNGLDPADFPFDITPKLSLGIVYHFPAPRR